MNSLRVCLTIFMALCLKAEGYKILVLIAFPGPSHHVYIQTFVEELVSRGHEVTAIACRSLATKSNITEIIIQPDYDLMKHMASEKMSIFEFPKINEFEYITRLYKMGLSTTEYALQNQLVQHFIENDQSHFDLIIAEQFFQESLLMFAHKYKAPIITMCTFGHSDYLDRIMGLQTPWSHIPHVFSLYNDKMTFSEKIYNVAISLYDAVYREYIYLPTMEEYSRKYFKSLDKYGPLPTIQELEKNISIIFINAHRALALARPYMPGIINIGGAHIRPAKILPIDIKKFIDEAEHGVIYFSFGAFIKSSQLPKTKLQQILSAFAQMKQRVLWKWEDDTIENCPPNVMVKKWLPQRDILAHPNVVVFISHGGLFGSFEGAYRGVPMLYIPIYGDQHRNAMRASEKGYANILSFPDLTTETLLQNLNELVYDPKYMSAVKKMSGLLQENPNDLMEEFIFWTEYVMKHKGAPGFKSSAVDMSVLSYMLVDVVLVVLVILTVIVVVVLRVLTRLICKKDTKIINKNKKKKN